MVIKKVQVSIRRTVWMTAIMFGFGMTTIHAQQETDSKRSRVGDSGPLSRQELAWNRTDRYVPPDFKSYFPEHDDEAAKRLDEFMGSSQLRTELPDEYIDVVRRGLRSTKQHKTIVLSLLGNTFIWGKNPQNEKAIELMYHASDADDSSVVHYAMYFGSTVVEYRSGNLMRMMMLNHKDFDRSTQNRLNWSFKTIGDRGRVADQLLALLDEHESLGDSATIAAYEYYKTLTGQDPPNAERFKGLGKWAIAFSHHDVAADQADGVQQLRDMLGQHLNFSDDKIIDYVARIDSGKWVGVALIAGLGAKEELEAAVKHAEGFKLEFSEQFEERLLQTRRLQEFAKHWDGEILRTKPGYTLPDSSVAYAWNCADKYVPPHFENYFPDDRAAGDKLDRLIESKDQLQLTDQEILQAFRQGLRNSKSQPSLQFSFLANAMGWPTDPMQMEIFYQASSLDAPRDIQSNAIYYGLGNWRNKSDNVLRLFSEILAQPVEQRNVNASMNGRILWSVRNDEQEKQVLADYIESGLNKHNTMDDMTLARVVQIYEQLAGETPANMGDFEDRGVFLIVWQSSKAKTKQRFAQYQDSIEQLDGFPNGKISFSVREEGGRSFGTAVVGGFKAKQWLSDELASDKSNSILAAIPWPTPWDLEDGLPGQEQLDRIYEKNRKRGLRPTP